MRFSILKKLVLFSLVAVLTIGCEQSPTASTDIDTDGLATSRIRNRDLVQVDRFGFPAVNTAFTDAGDLKDAFNTSAPANDEAVFLDDLAAVIEARYGLDPGSATAVADFVLPDIQPLGNLSGFPFGGRRLEDDVIDIELSALIFPGGPVALQSDGVPANDKDFLATFPYLASPHVP